MALICPGGRFRPTEKKCFQAHKNKIKTFSCENTITEYTHIEKSLKLEMQLVLGIYRLMSPLLGPGLPYGLHIRRTGHNAPRGPIIISKVTEKRF
jgi:hypothetical protein